MVEKDFCVEINLILLTFGMDAFIQTILTIQMPTDMIDGNRN
jgi:hypothetical protein